MVLRVAAADAQIAGDVVKAETVDPPLPHTGGPTTLVVAMVALVAAGAPIAYRLGRKVHGTGSAA